MYAALAPETPPVYSSPVDAQARTKLDEAYALSAEHYMKHGEAGSDGGDPRQPGRARRAATSARIRATREARSSRSAGEGDELSGEAADRKDPHKGPAPYLFLSPYLLLTAVFFVVPFVNAITLAFYETNGPRSRAFVGLDNFRFLLHDTNFHTALFNTTIFALVSVCVQLPLAMGLALLLNGGGSRVRGDLPADVLLAQPGRPGAGRDPVLACCSRRATA